MGMKVAAIALMCQDKRIFDAMMMAGTPCPFKGKIGEEATEEWDGVKEGEPEPIVHPSDKAIVTEKEDNNATILKAVGGVGLLLLLL